MEESIAADYIRDVRRRDPGIGGIKLWNMYKRDFQGNAVLGRDRFGDVVERYGFKLRMKVRKPRTTDSSHGLRVYPNLVKDMIPTAPNRLWVADITYVTIWTGPCTYTFCYVSLLMDAYTKELIGYSVGATLDATYPLAALRMALKRLEGPDGADTRLIHHSDRGVQYASTDYISLLRQQHIRISMTESGDPKDNAQAERVNNTLKNELFKGTHFTSMAEVAIHLERAVDFYNNERPHMSIDMKTPAEAARCDGEIRKRWDSHRERAIKNKLATCGNTEENVILEAVQGSPSGLRPPVNP